jgi:very-short-patch-repair endonuclease
MNQPRDLALAREAHWYRIPVSSADKWLARRWPPEWLAFYQTKVFGNESFGINYYARVLEIRRASRQQLFPDEPRSAKSTQDYFQLFLGPIQRLAKPILSRRWRRIVFIPTTWGKFLRAEEINDLYDESPLEDMLWAELKRLKLPAERQEFITANGADYALDFAIYCTTGKVDVETDGDTWHADPQRIPVDNRRDNDLETGGWKLLRFNSYHLNEEMGSYCLPTIVQNIQKLGGTDEKRVVQRDIQLDASSPSQMSLFDDQQQSSKPQAEDETGSGR